MVIYCGNHVYALFALLHQTRKPTPIAFKGAISEGRRMDLRLDSLRNHNLLQLGTALERPLANLLERRRQYKLFKFTPAAERLAANLLNALWYD